MIRLQRLLGGIARVSRITPRAAVKDRQTAAGGECVRALVLDGEHDVIASLNTEIPPSCLFHF
jgi:hypothetical protein